MVEEVNRPEYEKWLRFEAKRRYIDPVVARNAQLRRQEKQADQAARERAELAEKAATIWGEAFGTQVARQLDLSHEYWLIRLDRHHYAFDDRTKLLAASKVLHAGRADHDLLGRNAVRIRERGHLPQTEGIPAAFLTRFVTALVAVNPDQATLEAIVRERETARKREKIAQVEREATARVRQRDSKIFGRPAEKRE